MDDHPIKKAPENLRQSGRLLGDLEFTPDIVKPMGGLNHYSPFYDAAGKSLVNLLVQHAGLNNNSKLLDIGCGTGRIIAPLLDIIPPKSYTGFDNNKKFVSICKERHANVRVDHLDIQHDEFNPIGSIDPSSVILPYPDRSYDIISAFGVFNHFKLKWVAQYLRNVSRLLKPNGVFICTIILLNTYSMLKISENATVKPFVFKVKNLDGWTESADRPLLNIALPEISIRRVCIKSRLMIQEPIRYGQWCKSELAITGHDVIIARRSN